MSEKVSATTAITGVQRKWAFASAIAKIATFSEVGSSLPQHAILEALLNLYLTNQTLATNHTSTSNHTLTSNQHITIMIITFGIIISFIMYLP
ncbi:MAG: hypothetical protein WBZ36_12435 [Candidatus Nitrosopolaris sp.]